MRNKWLCGLIAAVGLALLLAAAVAEGGLEGFRAKAALLRERIVTDAMIEKLGDAPAGKAGYAVLLSVCDGESRAKVYSGTGEDLAAAWDRAVERAAGSDSEPLWVRADVVTAVKRLKGKTLVAEMSAGEKGFYFKGFALDDSFEAAFPEGELNGAGVYNYEKKTLSLKALNRCLAQRGMESLDKLPRRYTAFKARCWLCDENNAVYPLIGNSTDYGRRSVKPLDTDYVDGIVRQANAYLTRQLREDGSFLYGISAQYGATMKDYNILRHAGTIWAMLCGYRMHPDEAVKTVAERAIDYMLGQVTYDEEGTGYVYDRDLDLYELGGNGLAILAMTEYMDVFGNDRYRAGCEALGKGILKQQQPDGSYWQELDADLKPGEPFRTVYMDGECTFALARLYGLTGDQRWLDAACRAVDYFIKKDYIQYKDHWVSYSLNEVTKYVDDRQDYYDFALANVTENYERITNRLKTVPTNLELLMCCFETWQRMVDRGADTGDFDVSLLLRAIDRRAQHQLSGFFFPEYAMFMGNPLSVIGAFTMRDDHFRIRIDDVQHNMGGYYLYWKNYDKLTAAGLNAG